MATESKDVIAEKAAREIWCIQAGFPLGEFPETLDRIELAEVELFKGIVERAIAESQAPQPPHVTMQMLINAGLNAFGLQLFCESFAGIPKKPTETPFSFIFRGLTFTVARTEGEEIDTRHH